MKTILIEPVSNGWIVRHYQPDVLWRETDVTHVFNNLDDLMAAMPELLCDLRLKEEKRLDETPAEKQLFSKLK